MSDTSLLSRGYNVAFLPSTMASSAFSPALGAWRALSLTAYVIGIFACLLPCRVSGFSSPKSFQCSRSQALLQHSRRQSDLNSCRLTAPISTASPLFAATTKPRTPSLVSSPPSRNDKIRRVATRMAATAVDEKEPDGGIWWYY